MVIIIVSNITIIISRSKVTPFRSLGRPTAVTRRAPVGGHRPAARAAAQHQDWQPRPTRHLSDLSVGEGPWPPITKDGFVVKFGETMRKRFNLYDLYWFIGTSSQLMVNLGKRSISNSLKTGWGFVQNYRRWMGNGKIKSKHGGKRYDFGDQVQLHMPLGIGIGYRQAWPTLYTTYKVMVAT